MVYRKYHWEQNSDCEEIECTTLYAYVRIDKKWAKIGYYGSECKMFSKLDLKQEEEDRKLKQKARNMTKLIRHAKKMTPEQVHEQIKLINSS